MHIREKLKDASFSNELSDNILLEYYVTQKLDADNEPQLYFGIEIAKYTLENGESKLAEREHSGFFSQNRDFVANTAVMLADMTVTPLTMYNILDECVDFFQDMV